MEVLLPIWATKRETARRVRQRIGAVMKWAVAQGYREDNPAGDAISTALPKNTVRRQHQRALPHAQVAEALGRVRASKAHRATALAFEFLVLTACRSGEVRGARWDEVDDAAASWTVPPTRMKAKLEHRVPLSNRAVAVLDEAREIEALLTRARETDAAEDERFGESSRGDELPEELRRREDRLAAIRAARERLEARQREADDARGRKPDSKRNPRGGRPYQREYGEPEASAQDNFTDPESRIMKTSSEGYQQCYNPQVAVEGENQLIVATEVSSNASDQGHLVALLDAVEATHGERPVTVLGDRGDFRIAIRHGGDHSGTRIVLPVPEATRHDSTERLHMGGATRASGS